MGASNDLNGHHQEWLGSMTTNCHGVAAIETVSGCDKLVVGLTYAYDRMFDLHLIDVPDLVCFAVVAPIGNLDHSSLSAIILMAQAATTRGNSSTTLEA